jgi:small nuclear ribonucleoprotein (snRNP)-like protein
MHYEFSLELRELIGKSVAVRLDNKTRIIGELTHAETDYIVVKWSHAYPFNKAKEEERILLRRVIGVGTLIPYEDS